MNNEKIKAAKKEYVRLLAYCKPEVEEYPSNLLQLLDEAREKWIAEINSQK